MAKADTTNTTDKNAASAAPTRSQRRARIRPEPPIFDTPQAERAWHLEQEKRERERAEAEAKYPPGTKLYVTTARGIERRSRAGIAFNAKGRTEVTVVDPDAIEPTGPDDKNPTLEARVKAGAAWVDSLGAKAIAEDDGLVVLTSREAENPEDAPSDLQRRVAELEAENQRLREQLARKASGGDGRPERLATGTGKAASSDDFGGDKPKA